MPRGEGSADSRPAGHRAVDRDESLTALCRQAVQRLAAGLPGAQVYCHLRVGDVLRVVASEGGLRLIYEVRREQGGICWRAVETREPQLVEDVRRDPDYMTTDENVRSEVAVPVVAGDGTLLVLDAEFVDRTFSEQESRAVLAEAARLEAELTK
jgi:GAF domain-containing protein